MCLSVVGSLGSARASTVAGSAPASAQLAGDRAQAAGPGQRLYTADLVRRLWRVDDQRQGTAPEQWLARRRRTADQRRWKQRLCQGTVRAGRL